MLVVVCVSAQAYQPQRNQLRTATANTCVLYWLLSLPNYKPTQLRNRTTRSPRIPQEGRMEVAQSPSHRDRAPSLEPHSGLHTCANCAQNRRSAASAHSHHRRPRSCFSTSLCDRSRWRHIRGGELRAQPVPHGTSKTCALL